MSSLQEDAERLLELMKRLRRVVPTSPPPEAAQVSPSLMVFIDFVGASPGYGVKEIARALNLSAPTVSVGIRHLEDAGFIERRPHPSDKRAVQFFLTPKGQELFEQAHAFRRRTFEALLQGLTPEERQTLLQLWHKAISSAFSPPPSPPSKDNHEQIPQ